METEVRGIMSGHDARAFIEMLDPARPFWVVGVRSSPSFRGASRWETFHGPNRADEAEAWIAARHAEGVEVWLMLGDVLAPVSGPIVPRGVLSGSRFVAACAMAPEPFLVKAAGRPTTVYRDQRGYAVAIWELAEPVDIRRADVEAQRRAIKCAGGKLSGSGVTPWAMFAPLPKSLYAVGDGGSMVYRPMGGLAPLFAGYGLADELPTGRYVAGVDALAVPTASGVSVSLADVASAPIDWLWPGRIARKKLHLAGGDPGTGKSQFCAFVSARATAGGEWPCGAGEARRGGGVLWFSSEEDPAEEIRPRLEAAGADIRRVRILRDGWRIAGGIAELDREADILGDPTLLVLDPINSAIGSGVGTNDRLREAALSPLMSWAAKRNVAVIGILHPPKGGGSNPSNMYGSFKAYREVARVTMFAAADPENPDRMLMLLDKGNALAPAEKRAHAYRFEEVELSAEIAAPRIVFDDERVNLTAADWLAKNPATPQGGADTPGKVELATMAIEELLPIGGTISGPKIKRELDEMGFSTWAILEAAKALGVEQSGGNGKANTWTR